MCEQQGRRQDHALPVEKQFQQNSKGCSTNQPTNLSLGSSSDSIKNRTKREEKRKEKKSK